jgi:hypothetical protein
VELMAVHFAFPKKPNNPPAVSEGIPNHKTGLEAWRIPPREAEGRLGSGEWEKPDNRHVPKVTAAIGRTNVMNGTVAASRVSIVCLLGQSAS